MTRASFLRRWADVPLRRKTLLVVAIPTAALVLAVATFRFVERAERRASDEVTHAFEVNGRIDSIHNRLTDAESGVRGYLLTGNADWLAPYLAARVGLEADLDALGALVLSNAVQTERVQRLEPVLARRLAIMDEAQRTGPPRNDRSSARQSLLEEGHATTAEARRLLDEMHATEDAALVAGRRVLDETRARGEVLAAATVGVGAIGAVLATLLLTSGVAGRLRLVQENAARLAADDPLDRLPEGRDEVGQVARALANARTLLLEREHEVHRARSFLEHLIATGPVLMIRLSPSSATVEYVSPNVSRFLGYEPADVQGQPGWWPDHIHPDDLRRVKERQAASLGDQVASWDDEWRFAREDGTAVWVESLVIPEYDAAGSPTALLVYSLDVTARKLAEAQRDRTEEDLRSTVAALDDLYNNAPCGYHSLGPDGRFVRINDTELGWLGYSREEVVGKLRFVDLLTPEGEETFRAMFPRFMEQGVVNDVEYELIRRDGSRLPVRLSATAVYDGAGRFVHSRSTVLDATTRREIEAAREAAREAAEAANRAKSEFLSRMSHELRTPLNAILGFSQLLQLDRLTDEQAESVRYISTAGRHLLELINEILDISRIEAGTMTISAEPVDLSGLLSELVALVGPMADGRRITVDTQNATCGSYVIADRQRLKQVLLNLLANAVKYNRDGGQISVACQAVAGDRVRITVSDTGYGIAPEHMDRLFRPFDRLGAEAGPVEGTGMGLALSRGLVEAMGGAIGAESTLDRGSSFWVELASTDEPIEQQGPSPEALARPREDARRSVLQIEDNTPNLRLVEQIVARREGHRLVAAMQGRLGLELARRHRPDVVLLDVHLPDMSGYDVLQMLRTYPETRQVPVIVLSADATKKQSARFLAAGAHAYLTKPLDVNEFVRVLNGALAGEVAAR